VVSERAQSLVDREMRIFNSHLVGVLGEAYVFLSLPDAERQVGLNPGQPSTMRHAGLGFEEKPPARGGMLEGRPGGAEHGFVLALDLLNERWTQGGAHGRALRAAGAGFRRSGASVTC
jgi:hypothetical protein